MFESVFIEVDKSLLKSKYNVIIGEIYRPPSSDKKNLLTQNLKNYYIQLKNIKNMHFDGRLPHKYVE